VETLVASFACVIALFAMLPGGRSTGVAFIDYDNNGLPGYFSGERDELAGAGARAQHAEALSQPSRPLGEYGGERDGYGDRRQGRDGVTGV